MVGAAAGMLVVDNFSENNPDDTADICSISYQAKFKGLIDIHTSQHFSLLF